MTLPTGASSHLMENDRPQADAGNGHIQLDLHGREAIFSKLSYQYPLKLLSPRIAEQGVAIAYVLTYGGGLVSGDRINLRVDVGSSTSLVMLTQVRRSFLSRIQADAMSSPRSEGIHQSLQT